MGKTGQRVMISVLIGLAAIAAAAVTVVVIENPWLLVFGLAGPMAYALDYSTEPR